MNKVINSHMLQLMPNVIRRLKYTIEGKDDRHLFPLLSLPSSQQLAVEKHRIFFRKPEHVGSGVEKQSFFKFKTSCRNGLVSFKKRQN